MGVSLTALCDGCGRDTEDECYCKHCSIGDEAEVAAEVQDLAAAIRRGDTAEAEYLLDKIAADLPGWSNRVAVGRYSPAAKAA